MAGEQVYRAGGGKVTTIDWTAPANASKGDIVSLGTTYGFLLDDVTANGVVAVGLECDLVTVPQPSTARAWKADESVGFTGAEIAPLSLVNSRIGYVHHDVGADESRVPIVWRSTNELPLYAFYQSLDPTTTPVFNFPDITTTVNISRQVGAGYQYTMGNSNLLGIRPGLPITVEFGGSIDHFMGNGLYRISMAYILFNNTANRRVTQWIDVWQDGRRNRRRIIPMSVYNREFTLEVGDTFTNDDGLTTTVTQTDFDFGLAVSHRLRVNKFNDAGNSLDDGTIIQMHYANPRVVTTQLGGMLR